MTNIINNENTANYNSNSGLTSIVGTNGRPSAYGMFDMNGNVWEWTDTTRNDLGSGFNFKTIRGGSASDIRLDTAKEDTVFGVASLAGVVFGQGLRIASFTNPFNLPNFAFVGDINNTADDAHFLAPNKRVGSVSYTYFLNQYELTLKEYVTFLNAIAKTDTYNTYDLLQMSFRGIDVRIIRNGLSGNYSYSIEVEADLGDPQQYENTPAFRINWYNAARYCNWLHNNKPNGPQNSNTTENGAYPLNGLIHGPLDLDTQTSVEKNPDAKYHIPTDDEWYKAAYYKGGGTNSGYWAYATQSDTRPDKICQNNKGFVCPTPTPTISLTPTITLTPSVTPTRPTPTPTKSLTPTVTPTRVTRTPTKTVTASRSLTKTQTQTATPTKTVTATRSPTKTVTATRTPTKTTTATRTATPTPTPTPIPGNGLYKWSLPGNTYNDNNFSPEQIGSNKEWIDIGMTDRGEYLAIDSQRRLYGWSKDGGDSGIGINGHNSTSTGWWPHFRTPDPVFKQPTIVTHLQFSSNKCCYLKVFIGHSQGFGAGFAISDNDSVFHWGIDGGNYLLGNGTYPSKTIILNINYKGPMNGGVPISYMPTLSSVTKIVSSHSSSRSPAMVALSKNGELWGWGGLQRVYSDDLFIRPSNFNGNIYELGLPYIWGPTKMGFNSNWIDISGNLLINSYGKLYYWTIHNYDPLRFGDMPERAIIPFNYNYNSNNNVRTVKGFFSKGNRNNIGIVCYEISNEYNWISISEYHRTTLSNGKFNTARFAINRLGELYSIKTDEDISYITRSPDSGKPMEEWSFDRIGSSSNWVLVQAGPREIGYAINSLGELHKIELDNTTTRIGNRNDWRKIVISDDEALAIANDKLPIPSLNINSITNPPTPTPTKTSTPTPTMTSTTSRTPYII